MLALTSLSLSEGETLTYTLHSLWFYLNNLCPTPPHNLSSSPLLPHFALTFFSTSYILHCLHCHAFLSFIAVSVCKTFSGNPIIRSSQMSRLTPTWCYLWSYSGAVRPDLDSRSFLCGTGRDMLIESWPVGGEKVGLTYHSGIIGCS